MSSTIELMTILYQGRAGQDRGGEGDWLTREYYKEGRENPRHEKQT